MTSSRPELPASRPLDAERRFPPALLLALVALALLCRGKALGNGFVNYDDPQLLAEVESKGPVEIVSGPFYFAYKPVYGLWLWAEHALFGADAAAGHAASWLLFALCVALAALVLYGLTRSLFIATVAAALLAAHPVHTENVAWWAERKDVLSLALMLAAHLAYRSARRREPTRIPVLAAVLLALAGLAKGTAWAYAGVIALDEAVSPPVRTGRTRRLVTVLVVALLGVVLDAWFGAAYGPGNVHHDASTLELAGAMAGVHARYALSLLWPRGLSVDYPIDPAGSFASAESVVGLLLAAAAVVGLFVGVVRRRPLLALGCGIWVVGLAPINQLWPTTSILRADRYLVVPAIGAYVLLAAALARLRGAGAALAAVAVAVLALLAWQRAPVFGDSQSLWTDAIDQQPSSAIAFINRGSDDAERAGEAMSFLSTAAGRGAAEREAAEVRASAWWARAEADARAGIEKARALRRPELVLRARILRSTSLTALGRPDEALTEGLEAIEAAKAIERSPWAPGDPSELRAAALGTVGQALETRARAAVDVRSAADDFQSAITAWREATRDNPRSYEAWRNLGNLLAAVGGESRLPEAADAIRKAVALRPDDLDSVAYLVLVLYRLKKDDEAKALFSDAMRRASSPDARLGLRRTEARLAAEIGDPEDAEHKLSAILRDAPGDPETRAILHAMRKRLAREALAKAQTERDPAAFRKAVEAFDKAAEIAPRDADLAIGAADALLALGRFHDARLRYANAKTLAEGARWIVNFEGRAGVLEAAELETAGKRAEAARAMAEVVAAAPARLDAGFAAVLEAEVARLKPAADAVLGAASAERASAESLLVGAALMVAGDERGGQRVLAEGVGTFSLPPAADTRLGEIHDMARVLLAYVWARQATSAADLERARNQLEPVLARRKDDPLVAYHLLLVDQKEASARLLLAQGKQDPKEIAAAQARMDDVITRARALADRPDLTWPDPGLLAARFDVDRGEESAALRRFNVLAAKFPSSASVHRGIALVYQARAMASGGGELVTQAQRALLVAKEIDPRDPRTTLDLAQLYAISGDLESALRNALLAAAASPLPGAATQLVATILVRQGRKALEARDAEKAMALAESASRADPTSPAPDLLVGDVWTAKPDLKAALSAYERARRKAPFDADVLHALAQCHLHRGNEVSLWKARFPRPKEVAGKPPPTPEQIADWERLRLEVEQAAIREFEEFLSLTPEDAEAPAVRSMIEALRAGDPGAVERDGFTASRLWREGEALKKDGKPVDALAKYTASVEAWPQYLPSWARIAELALELGPDPELDGRGVRAADRVHELDADRKYPMIDLVAGRLWHRIAQTDLSVAGRETSGQAAARVRASVLARYLRAVDASDPKNADDIAIAKRLLEFPRADLVEGEKLVRAHDDESRAGRKESAAASAANARKCLERFLRAVDAADPKAAADVERAKSLLASLPKS